MVFGLHVRDRTTDVKMKNLYGPDDLEGVEITKEG